jgi:hypothetical protein
MTTTLQISIQTTVKPKEALFQENDVKDDNLLTTPDYLWAKQSALIDLSYDNNAKCNIWPTMTPPVAPLGPESPPDFSFPAPVAPILASIPITTDQCCTSHCPPTAPYMPLSQPAVLSDQIFEPPINQ